MRQARGFFYPQAEIRPDQGSNPQPAGCRRTAVTNWSDILWLYYTNLKGNNQASNDVGLTEITSYLMSFACQEIDSTFIGSFLLGPSTVIYTVSFPDQRVWPCYLLTIKYLHLTEVPFSNMIWLYMKKTLIY